MDVINNNDMTECRAVWKLKIYEEMRHYIALF